MGAGCADPGPGPPLAQVELGPSLDAGQGDSLLLTFAAARAGSSYVVDQGYTLAWDGDSVPAFTTQDAGDFGVVIEMDGYLYTGEYDYLTAMTVAHTASDAAVLQFALDLDTNAEIWFTAGSSSAATLDVRITSVAGYPRHVSILPWVRRCDAPFTGVSRSGDGLVARHAVTPDPRLADAGPGTFVTDFADALQADQAPTLVLGAASCTSSTNAFNDLATMIDQGSPPPASAAQIALRIDHDIPPYGAIEVRAHRVVADAAAPATLTAAVQAAQALAPTEVLAAGRDRLAAMPPVAGLAPEDALVYRSSFALLDQVTMPAQGKLAHDYYVFSRAPTWWSARLGQSVHESLAMILLAHLDPHEATETQRNFIDAVQPNGFLPSSIGPVVDQATAAAAPLFSFESWEMAKLAGDPTFVADAYAAGVKLHGFWTTQRDQDQDGLSEWGSAAESLRDPNNVIWTEVAQPDQVEPVDLNSMLVMEEKALAAMASSLGMTAEATQWQNAATARAALMNDLMWDDATGFYYDVSLANHTFTVTTPGDLKRMDIGGLLPLWAGIVPSDRLPALLANLSNPSVFLRTDGVASLSASDPFYEAGATGCCLWNGPVFVPWQWLLVRGLRGYGETALADDITQRTLSAVRAELGQSNQFRELYDPDDAGAANGSEPNYLWSAMVALMMLEGAGT